MKWLKNFRKGINMEHDHSVYPDKKCCIYLDIETTGFSPTNSSLTVIGLHLDYGDFHKTVQLIGNEISVDKLSCLTKNATTLYTYNGKRFDLPFIKAKLGVCLADCCRHEDLMFHCWERNLYGGLKSVEQQLGIKRKLKDIDGFMAVKLWHDYERRGNNESLKTLLEYNKEDVANLKVLRAKLNV